MNPVGIVLLEGADSAGKTTLARELVKRHDALYLHSTVRRNIWRWHVGAVRWATRESARRLIVMDRLWHSELTYGQVFRGGAAYDVGARVLDRVLRRFATLTVLCSPTDLEGQAARWATTRASGKHEHFDSVREVIALYADLRRGNLASSAPGYLGQLTRFGDYAERDDVLVYDMDEHRPANFAKRVVGKLEGLRRCAGMIDPTYHNLSGRGRRVMFVGEAPGTFSSKVKLPSWPWCGNEQRSDAAAWFNRALHHLAVDESKCCFTNARLADGTEDKELDAMIWSIGPKRVIALGKIAAHRLTELGVGHATVCHPQWHRRFRHHEGYEGYAEKIRWAMR